MELAPEILEALIFGTERNRRYTQDSPVMPDVWIEYGKATSEPVDLLLTPHTSSTAGRLGIALRERLGDRREAGLAYNESHVVVKLDFRELVTVALPLTHWWRQHVWRTRAAPSDVAGLEDATIQQQMTKLIKQPGTPGAGGDLSPDLIWLLRIVGRIELARRAGAESEPEPSAEELKDAALVLVREAEEAHPPEEPLLWRVDRNRPATTAIARSILAVKADAAVRLFDLNCRDLRWAVIDSGIDATHPAFRKRRDKPDEKIYDAAFEQDAHGRWLNQTRVIATYDFTRLRDLLNLSETAEERQRSADLRQALKSGRPIDWVELEKHLRIPHERGENKYVPPVHGHGTHVAGILTADWRTTDDMPDDHNLLGIASGLELYDLRVLKEDGGGDEFSVIAALQFVRHLNANKDRVQVHGVNLSLSIRHDVANYACGRTPVCEECARVVGAGTVVVAAAGNEGYARYETLRGDSREGYRSISITDPGNADGVITVGATHRYKPHSYGVSYFSSRGPTGDGRLKPDLVAPGEKIVSPIPEGRLKSMDGTSMAAPHVSAAAALLMARYSELIGQPAEIKRVLCETATDLGRERYFQGSGMLDVLRALQAV